MVIVIVMVIVENIHINSLFMQKIIYINLVKNHLYKTDLLVSLHVQKL